MSRHKGLSPRALAFLEKHGLKEPIDCCLDCGCVLESQIKKEVYDTHNGQPLYRYWHKTGRPLVEYVQQEVDGKFIFASLCWEDEGEPMEWISWRRSETDDRMEYL